MKKIRTLLFSSIPMLLAIGIQIFIMFYMLFIAAFFLFEIAPATTGVHYSFQDLIELEQSMDYAQIIYIIFCVCCIIIFGIWYVKRCNGKLRPNFKKTFHPLEILGIIFLIPGTQYLSSIITAFISMIFPSWLETYEELMETAGLNDDISLIMMIYTVLLAPISEELIFRGVTYRIARRAFPFWIANIIQAFLFGVFHLNMLQGCYTFILGLFLGYVCEKGGSIYHVIFFHFLFNLWGTTISQFLLVDNEILQALIIIVGAVVGLVLGLFIFQKGNKEKRALAE